MKFSTRVKVGRCDLKNPIIAAPGEHLIDEAGVRAAIDAGAGAVVLKSTNESEAARKQLLGAEYIALGSDWLPCPWDPDAPADVTLMTRSGLAPQSFDDWLDQGGRLALHGQKNDCLVVPSIILADLDHAVAMAGRIDAAGFAAVEFNIGTPYASQAARGAVTTELAPERVEAVTRAVVEAVSIPVWVKITGQSERVPDLAAAAFKAGAESVVMAGRLLGMLPDLETQAPLLGTSCGIGGYWNLPLTCHWLATTRQALGADRALIGINGATNGLDAARMMLAGASAVGFSSAVMLRGFGVITDAVQELEEYCRGKGCGAADLVGIAADRRRSFRDMPALDNHWRKFIPQQSSEETHEEHSR